MSVVIMKGDDMMWQWDEYVSQVVEYTREYQSNESYSPVLLT
jgi:hypothetical protein